MLTVGSLFSGIGGLELGLERAGMQVRWQVENDPYCIKVLEKHWPDVRRHDDITTFLTWTGTSTWDVDLVCGGFPCQPVSTAGKRQGDADERWLWDEMRRVCEVVRPRWVLAENVPGLLSASTGRLFGAVVRDLAALGYVVEWFCLSAANVGANHIRDRVFIVGCMANACIEGLSLPGGDTQQQIAVEQSGDGSTEKAREVADAQEQPQWSGLRKGEQTGQQRGRSGDIGSTLANAAGPRLERPEPTGCILQWCKGLPTERNAEWWSTEPDVGRVADGIPRRVDRLRCLGNAVVPQVAEYIGRMIVNAHP